MESFLHLCSMQAHTAVQFHAGLPPVVTHNSKHKILLGEEAGPIPLMHCSSLVGMHC